MIVRMREVRVRPGSLDAYLAWLADRGWPRTDGFVRGERFRSYDGPDERVVEVTWWRDEAALAAWAGAAWRTDPQVGDGERDLVARDPHVWHFVAV